MKRGIDNQVGCDQLAGSVVPSRQFQNSAGPDKPPD